MTSPNPSELARQVARRDRPLTAAPALPAPPTALPAPGVVFAYVDNSNIWIEGRRIQAVRLGLARNPYEAMERRLTAPWSYDFGRLYALVCPPGSAVGRSMLVGSRPPPNDTVWQRAHAEGFQVEVFDRNVAGKEKQVDSTIVTRLMEDSFQHMRADRSDLAVLAAGDGDYVPCVRSLQERGLKVRLVFWMRAASRQLRDIADEFVALDPFFDHLTHPPAPRGDTGAEG